MKLLNKKKITMWNLVIIFCLYSNHAHAYLDPGTFSLIFQTIIATLVGAIATFNLWYSQLMNFFKKKLKKRKK